MKSLCLFFGLILTFSLQSQSLTATISGQIKTAQGELIGGVTVELLDENGQTVAASYNNANYTLTNVPTGQSYTIRINKPGAVLNGVSTFDIVLLHKFILAIDASLNPYQLIAGDVNQSGTLTTRDIVYMRSLVLGLTNTLPDNGNWRFFPTGLTFQNPQNPFFDLGSTSHVIQVDGNISDLNYTGVKLGDVNDTALPSE
ncbi:MAG: hypothetical protein R2828_24900 [Saprospiraceae bacterium]